MRSASQRSAWVMPNQKPFLIESGVGASPSLTCLLWQRSPCAKAYLEYRERRRAESSREAPSLPLPDFFIGAHAQVMGWPLVTADAGRFRTYFPSVTLLTP
jgi:hypothetical protein